MYVDADSVKYRHFGDERHVVCSITTTELPDVMPETGVDVLGLDENDILDTGTTLLVTNDAAVYMMDEERVFQPVG